MSRFLTYRPGPVPAITPVTTTSRTCPVCCSALPEAAPARQIYCCSGCSYRARARRTRGLPIADPPSATAQDDARAQRIRALELENARLRRLVARVRATSQKWHSRSSHAADRVSAARAHAEEREVAAARRVASVGERLAEAERVANHLRAEAKQLRKQLAYQEQLARERQSAAEATRHMAASISAERQRFRKINQHFRVLAGRYFRRHTPETWDEFDREIYSTYQSLRASTPTKNGKRTR